MLRDEPPAAPYSLADLPLFHGLPPSAVAALEAAAKDVDLTPGDLFLLSDGGKLFG